MQFQLHSDKTYYRSGYVLILYLNKWARNALHEVEGAKETIMEMFEGHGRPILFSAF